MRPSVLALVAARVGSARRPGKVLAQVAGASLLEHVVARLRMARTVRTVIVTTTTLKEDDAIVKEAGRLGISCYRGHPPDVTEQLAGAVAKFSEPGDLVFRAMSDQPFLDWRSLDFSVSAMVAHDWDFALPLTFGADPVYGAGLSSWSLRAWEWIHSRSVGDEREHPGMRLRRDLASFKYGLVDLPHWAFRPYRLEVDTDADLALINKVWSAWGRPEEPLLRDVVRILDRNQELALVNSHVQEKTGPYTSFSRAEVEAWEKDYAGRWVVFTDLPSAVGTMESKSAQCRSCGGLLVTVRLGSKRVKFRCLTCGAEQVYKA